ncbi:subunit of the ESCRT-I complex [Dunaliella salina]|uniref:Vacuolar protein sorting-associated protein 28 homolog n=1 Tax=Dunaliella salina TaxID=3046 RepID=A0ABQ7G1W4_DUNSA|nr:subunit of the ESCRT-I complex [Dunaliella salina]|eukprot:KAF5828560.1 subunit of the ESCRT-I complex [Dunaliella salina]
MSTQGPVRLWSQGDRKEMEVVESKADLFAILKATEKLERAYVRDAVAPEMYEKACEKLILQFKVLWGSLRHAVPDVEQFMNEHNMQCPLAASRLIHVGMPATIEHTSKQRSSAASAPEAAAVAEAVQHFITTMDALKLNMVAIDQICPLLMDLMTSMDRIQSLPPNYGPREKIKEWYSKLYQKPANYELREAESRQMLYDLESSYNTFFTALKSRS